jgi:hypothetical protein
MTCREPRRSPRSRPGRRPRIRLVVRICFTRPLLALACPALAPAQLPRTQARSRSMVSACGIARPTLWAHGGGCRAAGGDYLELSPTPTGKAQTTHQLFLLLLLNLLLPALPAAAARRAPIQNQPLADPPELTTLAGDAPRPGPRRACSLTRRRNQRGRIVIGAAAPAAARQPPQPTPKPGPAPPGRARPPAKNRAHEISYKLEICLGTALWLVVPLLSRRGCSLFQSTRGRGRAGRAAASRAAASGALVRRRGGAAPRRPARAVGVATGPQQRAAGQRPRAAGCTPALAALIHPLPRIHLSSHTTPSIRHDTVSVPLWRCRATFQRLNSGHFSTCIHGCNRPPAQARRAGRARSGAPPGHSPPGLRQQAGRRGRAGGGLPNLNARAHILTGDACTTATGRPHPFGPHSPPGAPDAARRAGTRSQPSGAWLLAARRCRR